MIDPFDGLPRAGDIETDRLRMRPLRLDDAEALFPVFDDERLHVFTGGAPATVEELRARLEAWSGERSPDGAQAWLNWLVIERGDDAPIGIVQATVERDAAEGLTALLAWTVGCGHQGRGFASEAATALARWLSAQGVARLEAHIHPDHQASAGVAGNA